MPDMTEFRPFLPARDFRTSCGFYTALGFAPRPLGDKVCEFRRGGHAFLLQDFYVKEWAENAMMHAAVDDLDGWCKEVAQLDFAAFGTKPPSPPRREPWGITVSYLHDPSGVLWHVTQRQGGA